MQPHPAVDLSKDTTRACHKSDMPTWTKCPPVWWMIPAYLGFALLAALTL